MARGPMILSAFFFNPQGDHRMSWRHPRAPRHEVFDLSYYRQLAEAAAQAKIDALFVADHVAIWDSVPSGVAHYANARLEPLTILCALAVNKRRTSTPLSFTSNRLPELVCSPFVVGSGSAPIVTPPRSRIPSHLQPLGLVRKWGQSSALIHSAPPSPASQPDRADPHHTRRPGDRSP